MTSYRIPAAWDPGYALPQYVKDEGLRMRAFVTKWAPRGTYDDPDAFDPSWDHGYAIPEYMKQEGYGQGAYVTEWAPRGTYAGVVKRHAKRIRAKQQALGDVTMPGVFATYGRLSAATILQHIQRLPAHKRKAVIASVLNRIDPALYTKAEEYSRRYQSDGADAASALELGLSRAMSEGIGDELVKIGKSGKRPPAKGQVGLGCYGRRALGAETFTAVTSALQQLVQPTQTQTYTSSQTATQQAIQQARQMEVDTSVTMRPGWCWVKQTSTGCGYWVRAPEGGCAKLDASTLSPPDPSSCVASPSTTGWMAPPETKTVPMIQVGPFVFPKDEPSGSIRWHMKLPAAWQTEIKAVIGPGGNLSSKGYQLDKFFDSPPTAFNSSFVGILAPGNTIDEATKASSQIAAVAVGALVSPLLAPLFLTSPKWKPIFRTKHPVSGKDYGVYIGLSYAYRDKPMSDPANPPTLHVFWKEIDKSWYVDVWTRIKEVIAKVVDAAGEILDEVGKIACNLLNTPGAETAGAAAAASQGAPPQAGQQGVEIAKQACNSSQPPPPAEGQFEWLLPVAIGGGVILAAMLLLPKKKRRSTSP